jgi:hypothetical protein
MTTATTKDAAVNGKADVLYVSEDWMVFRSVGTISQFSGVPRERLRRLVAKEVADNGLDTGAACRVGELPGGGFFVEDDGPGIAGGPEKIARLFSFRRPRLSSKLLRRLTRGALGNGLRVLAGAVYASGGGLRVITRGQSLELSPQESGDTKVKAKPCKRQVGTRVEVYLGDAIPGDPDFLKWAREAVNAAGPSPIYTGKPSPWWHDSDSFFELLKAAGSRSVREVMQDLDGYDALAGKITGRTARRTAASLSYEQADKLLDLARSSCGPVGPESFALLKRTLPGKYAKAKDTLDLAPGRGSLAAAVPYTVEAWCDGSPWGDRVTILVNRTPVACEVGCWRAEAKAELVISGCNLRHRFTVGKVPVKITISVQAPYVPLTSTGKEPDLEPFLGDIMEAVEAAARSYQRANRTKEDRPGGLLPSRPRGRPGPEKEGAYVVGLLQFADLLKEIDSRVDFKMSSRGWCYVLENEGRISKGEFDRAQDIITECRKRGILPIDFTAEDEARLADNLEACDDPDPVRHAQVIAATLGRWQDYAPVSFWDFQPVYIQMVVEKIDLKNLFLPVCREYHVPITNARGWSDLNLRVALMRRFKQHEEKGRRPVLLYCGDLDPPGLHIGDSLPDLLGELEQAVGWSPRNLTFDRFGLNEDFIEEHGLTWIDGLKTASGKDLGDPIHRHHGHDYVQEYIKQFGRRKVEANALVVRPEAGRQLCRDAITTYLDLDRIAEYEGALAERRARLREALPDAVRRVLESL